jgi:hypothetical protein
MLEFPYPPIVAGRRPQLRLDSKEQFIHSLSTQCGDLGGSLCSSFAMVVYALIEPAPVSRRGAPMRGF